MKEYILPIGVDGEKAVNPFNDMISKMEQVEGVARDTGKSLNDALANGAKGADVIDQKLKPITKGLEAVKVLGAQAGKELADAFNNRNIDPSGLEKAVASFRSKLDNIGGLKLDIDDSQLAILEKHLESASDEMDELRIATEFAKQTLESLDPNSAEYQQLAEGITFVETALNEFGNEIVETTGKQKTLKSELREIKNELNKLELAGETGSEKFRQLRLRAGELEDQIGDTNAQIKILASDTAKFDGLISGVQGLVGGFTAAQGAIALFGTENEELEKALLRVNGAMAVLQGLQAVSETLNKDSAFSVIFLSGARKADAVATGAQTAAMGAQTVATRVATIATKGFSLALKTIGIGLVIAAIAYLVEYWDDLKAALNRVLPAGQSVGRMFDKLKATAFGVGNAIVQGLIAPIKAIYYATQGEWKKAGDALAGGFKVAENYQKGHHTQTLRNEEKYSQEREAQDIKNQKRELERKKNRGQNVYAEEQKLRAREIALAKKRGEDTAELQKEMEDESDRHYNEQSKKRAADIKKSQADAKQKAEEAKKAAEELRKQREEEAKRNNELVKKYTEEASRIEIDAMEEGIKKTLATIEVDRRNKVSAIEAEAATTGEAIKAKNDLIEKINADAKRRSDEAEKKANEEKAKLRLEGLKMIEDLSKDSAQREINIAKYENEAKIADINEKFKNETDLRDKLLMAQAEYFAAKNTEINKKYAKQSLADEEERLILTAELTAIYAGNSEKIEEQKQLAILEIKSTYAQKQLDELLKNGGKETDIEVLKARKLVEDTQKAVEEETKKGKKFDFFEFIGLDVSKDQKKAMADAGKTIMDGAAEITEFISDQYQRQIDKKQESIDQVDDEIGDLEDRLGDEKDLKDQGFANDYDRLQQELEAKKAQRDEELRQQEEMRKKQQRAQKAQMAIDTAMQLVNLITASTEIFKSLAGIPFVGIPLAIATIGVMFGAFAASKVKAFQNIKDGQKFRYGGDINGSSHEAGGVKYYSADGTNIELEGGEYVVRKDKRRKYRGLLDAMNTGDFNGLTIADVGLRALFEDLGINFDSDSISDAVGDSKTLNGLRSGVNINVKNDNDYFRRMDENIGFLARKKREEVVSWEDENYYYTKIGTKTTKTRKKQWT